jgi:hypothetical protein
MKEAAGCACGTSSKNGNERFIFWHFLPGECFGGSPVDVIFWALLCVLDNISQLLRG